MSCLVHLCVWSQGRTRKSRHGTAPHRRHRHPSLRLLSLDSTRLSSMQVLSPSPSLDLEQDDCSRREVPPHFIDEHEQQQQQQHKQEHEQEHHHHPDFHYHPPPPLPPQQQMPIQPSRLGPDAVADNEALAADFSYSWSYEEEEQMVEGFYDSAHQYHVRYHYPYYHPEAYAARVGLYGAMDDPQWQPQMAQVGGVKPELQTERSSR